VRGHPLTLADALGHVTHLSCGAHYQRGCGYCEMSIKVFNNRNRKCMSLNREVREDIEFYDRAQKSGKFRIDL
jgi:hypothetical protein